MKSATKSSSSLLINRSPISQIASQTTLSAGCESTLPAKPDFGRFSSLHGTRETEEGIRQVVISQQWPKCFLSYLRYFLENPNADWKERAAKVNLPLEELHRLVNSPEGADLFSENIRRAKSKGITVSPRLELNGKIVRFPSNQEDLRVLLCSAGVLKENCIGILCSKQSPCPEKFGYTAECKQDKCFYKQAPLREDAVQAYLIIPKNCIPAEEFPIAEGIKGWASALKITHLALTDSKAQELLKETKISSFPVLVVENDIKQRNWGARCIKELNLTTAKDRFLTAFDYTSTPFPLYARVRRTKTGELQVIPNHYSSALFLHKMEKLEAAAKSYRLALTQNPEDYRAWNNLGAILYDKQDLKKAGGAMFKKALALNNSYEPALTNLLRFQIDQQDPKNPQNTKEILEIKNHLAWLMIEKKRWSEAGAYFKEVLTSKDLEFSARKGLAFMAVQEGRHADALADLKRCLEINPDPDGDFVNLLAGVYFRLNDQTQAIEWYQKALIAPEPSPQAYANLCYLLEETKQWEKLLVVSTAAIDADLKNTKLGFYKANALNHLNRSDEAIKELERLSQLSKEAEFQCSYQLALLYQSRKEKAKAVSYAQQFIDIVAIQTQPALQSECMTIADAAIQMSENQLASEALLQVLRMKPSDVAAHKKLAICYEKMGQPDRSREHSVLAKQFGGDDE